MEIRLKPSQHHLNCQFVCILCTRENKIGGGGRTEKEEEDEAENFKTAITLILNCKRYQMLTS